jgi:hypothetical protein
MVALGMPSCFKYMEYKAIPFLEYKAFSIDMVIELAETYLYNAALVLLREPSPVVQAQYDPPDRHFATCPMRASFEHPPMESYQKPW